MKVEEGNMNEDQGKRRTLGTAAWKTKEWKALTVLFVAVSCTSREAARIHVSQGGLDRLDYDSTHRSQEPS